MVHIQCLQASAKWCTAGRCLLSATHKTALHIQNTQQYLSLILFLKHRGFLLLPPFQNNTNTPCSTHTAQLHDSETLRRPQTAMGSLPHPPKTQRQQENQQPKYTRLNLNADIPAQNSKPSSVQGAGAVSSLRRQRRLYVSSSHIQTQLSSNCNRL